jgi:photosystem II stability/assembly factor-like uncharacterized protein
MPLPSGPYSNYDVCFLDSNYGYVVGVKDAPFPNAEGAIYRTTDGGITWDETLLGRMFLGSVCFKDSNSGIAVGNFGAILRTTDGGDTWDNQSSFTRNYFVDVSFADRYYGIILGGGMLRTTDEGNTWIPITTCYSYLDAVTLANSNYGMAVGGHIISKTTDGGITWEDQEFPSLPLFRGVSFIDTNHATVVGKDGIILHTTNGGENWVDQQSNTTEDLQDVCFTDIYRGTAVGDWGTILITTDGGNNWTQKKPSGTLLGEFWAVSFADSKNGWIVIRGSGTVLRTSDYGNSWVQQTIGTTGLFDVCFTDSANGTIVGNAGTILRTTDGGDTWIQQISGITAGMEAVSFSDPYNGTAVGGHGLILRTTNGGVTFVEEKEINAFPTNYTLTQNYPNPFNPSTKIKFLIPQTSDVVIKVYDVLGNEIETLVNEEKPSGAYEITWYAEGLPSGVYFYQLQAGDFIQTKKMILMK